MKDQIFIRPLPGMKFERKVMNKLENNCEILYSVVKTPLSFHLSKFPRTLFYRSFIHSEFQIHSDVFFLSIAFLFYFKEVAD